MNKKIVALSWHPATSKFLTSGGYTRFYEIAKRSQKPLVIIDRFPSIYHPLLNKRADIIEYGKLFNVKFLLKINPYIYKLFDRLVTSVSIFIILMKIKREIKVIYVPYSELIELTFAAILFKAIFRVPIVLCNLNVNTYFIDKPINIFLHRFANQVITISSSLRKDLEKNGIHVTQVNGVGFDIKRTKSSHKKFYDAIFVGRHIPQKGIYDLIDIWNLIVNKYHKNCKLITVGDIPDFIVSDIKMRIKTFGLENSIIMLGKISDKEKNSLFLQSKMMVFPSKQEGWGIAPMEALEAGLPVVAYNLPVYNESIGSTKAFKRIDINDIKTFTKMTLEVINNYNVYSRFAKRWKPIQSWVVVANKEWDIINNENDIRI